MALNGGVGDWHKGRQLLKKLSRPGSLALVSTTSAIEQETIIQLKPEDDDKSFGESGTSSRHLVVQKHILKIHFWPFSSIWFEQLQLNGKKRDLTKMFSKIKDFLRNVFGDLCNQSSLFVSWIFLLN